MVTEEILGTSAMKMSPGSNHYFDEDRRLKVIFDPVNVMVDKRTLRIGYAAEVWPTQARCSLALPFNSTSAMSCNVHDVGIGRTEMKCFCLNVEYLLGARDPDNAITTTSKSP